MVQLRTVGRFLGLQRSIVGMLTIVILVGLGERLGERFLPLYLVAVGGSTLVIGLLGFLQNFLGALYSFPGGFLSDRLGVKRALLLFNLIAMVGFLIVALLPAWQAVIVGAFFFLAWSAISLPATMSLIAKVLPKQQRTMGVSMHSLVRRIPMALGPVLGGLLIAAAAQVHGEQLGRIYGVRYAFAAAAVLSVVAIIVQQLLIEDDHSKGSAEVRLSFHLPPTLRRLLISDILIRFCEQMPYAFVVLWVTQTKLSAVLPGFHPVSEVQFGILTSIEMATAMLVYIPVAYFADKGEKKPFVVITFLFFTLFPLALYYSRSFVPLIFAFILRGMKEFGEPTRKALIVDLSPEGKQAATFGAYYLIRDLIVSLAALAGAYLWNIHPAANLFTAFGFGLLGTLWFAIWGKDTTVPSQEEIVVHG